MVMIPENGFIHELIKPAYQMQKEEILLARSVNLKEEMS